jgi:hypothetical protein
MAPDRRASPPTKPGTYQSEWFSVEARDTVPGDTLSVDTRTALALHPPNRERSKP